MEPVDPREKELKALTRALARERERSELLETISRRQSDVAARIRSDLEVQLLAKATFMATMSHEIRTPIHGVMGMLQLLETTNPTQEQEEFLSAARGAAETLLTIINDVLDYSKLDLSRVELESTPFTLEDVVDAACGSLGPRAAQAGVRLYLLVDGGLPRRVEGDASRLMQILNNLINNAVKFTPRGGRVVVRAWWEAEQLCLDVQDTGIGIAPENAERVFEPFMQAEASIHRRFGGTGLGLSICRRLARRMGGEVVLLKSQPGEGTTFRVTLPLAPIESPPRLTLHGTLALALADTFEKDLVVQALESLGIDAVDWKEGLGLPVLADEQSARALHLPTDDLWLIRDAEDHAPSQPRGVVLRPVRRASLRRIFEGSARPRHELEPIRHRVLVAEDNAVNQRLAQAMLERLGCTCVVVNDGSQAVARAAAERWDLVLMDCEMPVLNGFEATLEIRRLPPPHGVVPIVAVTANALSDDRRRCLDSGMNDFLAKPFKMGVLEALLRKTPHLTS